MALVCPSRWPETKGRPYCPACGCLEPTAIRRRHWRCTAKECRHEFSVTSGTVLANRKLSFRTLVLAIALPVHSVKGKAPCQLKRELGVDYKTAFVLLHKLREAVAAQRDRLQLGGVVEIDGIHVGGHVRPANKAEDRVDRRYRENTTGKPMAVVALRERGVGAPTLAVRAPEERADLVRHLVKNHMVSGASELQADEARAYDRLEKLVPLERNDHSKAFSRSPDASTNQVESFFSRARRAEVGIHHRMAGKYLDWYAADLAWREDHRKVDFRMQARLVLAAALAHPVSRNMCGYWQRSGKAREALAGWNPPSGLAERSGDLTGRRHGHPRHVAAVGVGDPAHDPRRGLLGEHRRDPGGELRLHLVGQPVFATDRPGALRRRHRLAVAAQRLERDRRGLAAAERCDGGSALVRLARVGSILRVLHPEHRVDGSDVLLGRRELGFQRAARVLKRFAPAQKAVGELGHDELSLLEGGFRLSRRGGPQAVATAP